MSEGSFSKICITLRRDQVSDLKVRSRNVSKIVRDAVDYYLTLDIGSSDIAIYEIRRDVKKILGSLPDGSKASRASAEKAPSEALDEDLGVLRSIMRNERDAEVIRLMLDRGHESTKRLVEELGYSRTESIRDKLNSLNRRSEETFGRPLFRYFRSRDGFDYSWWMIVGLDELSENAQTSKKTSSKKKTSKTD